MPLKDLIGDAHIVGLGEATHGTSEFFHMKHRIIDFLAQHPGSTAGDVAKGLNLNPGSASTRLTQLAKTGEIRKASRGYTTK